MPWKPKKPCAYPDCPRTTYGKYCDEHKQTDNRRYNKERRNPALNKRYGSEWKKIRDRYIAANPLCELCNERGRFVAAEVVHHKIELEHGGTHDFENLQSLCKSCHSRIHGFV